ncbi:hypothetical protein VIGAN_08310300 [Vigna angularis var. angularis]|uniref:Aminotransferase-like plant mobile domain-containing protein n=1 Tax=Vigna angularis var. angularis TaxID=157739 RepID=A0A0S3STN7_PHAAN|nr:hypothetical protein VIGAN_08310300 [Vigna angularis var. angularis]
MPQPYNDGPLTRFTWAPYEGLESIIPAQAYKDQALWTSCTTLICFAIVEWHQSDRVKLQFRLSQHVPELPNNLDDLHKVDMKGKQDENWGTRHAQWIDVWNNRRDLTLTGIPVLGPLIHTSEYMSWYFENAILFLSVPQMLNDPRMHRALTSTHLHSPEYHHSRDHENTHHAEASMDARRHSLSSFSNLGMPSLFGTYAPTTPSAHAIGGPYDNSFYFVESHNKICTSFATYGGGEGEEHIQRQPSPEEPPRPPQEEPPRPPHGRRNPTRNRRVKGVIGRARALFEAMPRRNAISWTVMINRLLENGLYEGAREVFGRMP